MEAYFLFRYGAETTTTVPPETAAMCEEQLEDIGAPSDSDESPSTSTELEDDDAASSPSGRRRRSFEMASLMTQLPLKRGGLSRFFDGKSRSFSSLQAVASLDDLAKPARKRLKPASRSCAGGLDAHRGRLLPPPKPAKKVVARSGALAVLGAATRRSVLARPDGVASKVLVVS